MSIADELLARIGWQLETLSSDELAVVLEWTTTLSSLQLTETILPGSDIASPEFAAAFRNRLRAHHAINPSRLSRTQFEDAFESAGRAAGRHIGQRAGATERFWDVCIDDRRISLKTEGAQSLRESFLHISKLTEAAWIQDCRTQAARRDRTIDLFGRYEAAVDRIIVLRAYPNQNFYELVEIPTSIFSKVGELPLRAFTAESPSIPVPFESAEPDFTLKLDRSDAKITIARIRKATCIVHATWSWPLSGG